MQNQSDSAALVEIAAQATDVHAFEQGTLEVMRQRLGFDVALFSRAGCGGAYGVDPAIELACRPLTPQFKRELSAVRQVALEGRGVAVDVEVLGMRRLERTSVYQRLMKPHRGTSTALLFLARPGALQGSIALGRTHGSFNQRELAYLESLVPTLTVCEAAMQAPRRPRSSVLNALTPREREVLEYLPLGYTNAQVARALGSAERTVRNQLSSIYEKLGVASRAEAVALWAEQRAGGP